MHSEMLVSESSRYLFVSDAHTSVILDMSSEYIMFETNSASSLGALSDAPYLAYTRHANVALLFGFPYSISIGHV